MPVWHPKARHQCADCEVWEGELHREGCSIEECPAVGCGWTRLQCPVSTHRALRALPCMLYPVLCARCGSAFPPIFWVSDPEWVAIVSEKYRHLTLCKACFAWMRRTLRQARQTHQEDP